MGHRSTATAHMQDLQHASLVVRGSPAIDVAVLRVWLKRRSIPQLQRVCWLHIVVSLCTYKHDHCQRGATCTCSTFKPSAHRGAAWERLVRATSLHRLKDVACLVPAAVCAARTGWSTQLRVTAACVRKQSLHTSRPALLRRFCSHSAAWCIGLASPEVDTLGKLTSFSRSAV